MAKFSRVVLSHFKSPEIIHAGQKLTEEHEGTGLYEVSHQHADELIKAGMVKDFAPDMDAALEKLTGSAAPAAEKKDEQPAAKSQGGKKL